MIRSGPTSSRHRSASEPRRVASGRRLGSERGSSAIEFILLVPIFVFFVELIVLGGRIASINADVQSAAREAARQASVASGPGSAANLIGPTANASLQNKGVSCQSGTAIFGPGTNFVAGGSVEVTVTCTVNLSDVDLLSAPGSIQVTKTAAEPIEKYRVVKP